MFSLFNIKTRYIEIRKQPFMHIHIERVILSYRFDEMMIFWTDQSCTSILQLIQVIMRNVPQHQHGAISQGVPFLLRRFLPDRQQHKSALCPMLPWGRKEGNLPLLRLQFPGGPVRRSNSKFLFLLGWHGTWLRLSLLLSGCRNEFDRSRKQGVFPGQRLLLKVRGRRGNDL